jgi:hypothetical protein
MRVLAGSDGGVFAVSGGQARQLLESRCVRDLVRVTGRVFAGTDAGLFVSDDEGASWAPRGLEDRQVWQVRDAGDGSLYVCTQPAGLFRSGDGGDTWQEIDSLTEIDGADAWCLPVDPPAKARARALVIDQANPQRIRLGVEVGGIMGSDDGGKSWNVVLPGDNPDLHMMIADPARPGVLYTSTGYGRFDGEAERVEGNAGMFRSDDFGATWRYVWAGIEPRYSRPLCVDPRPPHGVTVGSAPSAFSKCRDEQGAEAMLFRSEDGCETWRSLCDAAHSPSRANFHGLAPDPELPGGVIVGTDTGEVWRVSSDADWTLLGEGMPLVASVLPPT